MSTQIQKRFAVGALQLAVTVILTSLGIYLLLAGKMSANILGLLLMTCIIFGLAIWETRDKWRRWLYWLTTLGCLTIHAALVALLWGYVARLPTAILGVLGTLECAGIFWILLLVGE